MGMGWPGDGLGCEERCRQRPSHTGLRGTGLDRNAKIRAACLKAPRACSKNRGGKARVCVGRPDQQSVSVAQVRSKGALPLSHE